MRRTYLYIVLGLAQAVPGGAAFTAGVIPGADGVIHGCYDNCSSVLRAIDPAVSRCKNNETAIEWSQVGPQGPQGLKGDRGETGAQGIPGISGYQIVQGPSVNVAKGERVDSIAVCPAGKKVIGGGGGAIGPSSVYASGPEYNDGVYNTWRVTSFEGSHRPRGRMPPAHT